MSTYGIEGVIEALTAAKEAQDALPGLRSRINELERSNQNLEVHTSSLEQKIADLQGQLAAANVKTSEVTRERDEAQFRELEASDKFTNAQAVLRKIVGEVSDFTSAVEPKGPSAVEEEHSPLTPGHGSSTTQESSSTTASNTASMDAIALTAEASDLAPIITGLNHPAPAQVPRFAGMAYWSKPDDVSWEEFITNGGEKAPWDHKTYS